MALTAPIDYSGFLAMLMPKLTHAKLMRATAWFCLTIGLLFGVPSARIVCADLYARACWPVTSGEVFDHLEKSRVEHSSGTRSTSGSSWTVYWIEFDVQLAIPVGNCKTGTFGVNPQFACVGTVRTLATKSWVEAQNWVQRHPPNRPEGFFYDPAGRGIRFADESIWNLYPWGNIALFLGLTTSSIVFLRATQRRIRELYELPEDYDASPPVEKVDDPNKPIELKLS